MHGDDADVDGGRRSPVHAGRIGHPGPEPVRAARPRGDDPGAGAPDDAAREPRRAPEPKHRRRGHAHQAPEAGREGTEQRNALPEGAASC
eukprot:2166971-Rhodomonas_salina.4